MLRRSLFGSSLGAWPVLLAALGASGCLPILDLGQFQIEDGLDSGARDGGSRDSGPPPDGAVPPDAAPRDGGPRDAGCPTPTTYYLDADGDTYGDPATAVEACSLPSDRHVTRGGDCDDADDTRHPGAPEVCDGVDQDCDEAVDEGLIGPIGPPVQVTPTLAVGAGVHADGVAHANGFTVAWRARDHTIRASFFDRAGNPVRENVTVATGSASLPVRTPVVTRFSTGLEQVFIAWLDPDGIRARLCSTSGTCNDSVASEILSDTGTSHFTQLRTIQFRRNIILQVRDLDRIRVLSVDPPIGVVTGQVMLPLVPDLPTNISGPVVIDGPEPSILLSRTAALAELPEDTPPGVVGVADILRVRGSSTLAYDAVEEPIRWDPSPRCAALDRRYCSAAFLSIGNSSESEPVLAFETLAGADAATDETPVFVTHACAMTTTASGTAEINHCVPMPVPLFAMGTARGSVGTIVSYFGAGYGTREVPLRSSATGSTWVALPADFTPIGSFQSRVTMHGAHGGVLGSTTSENLTVQRLGCEPAR